ncbi:MAG: hypothetical protein IKZ58_10130 [Selenomonadaceae bacterium]|nr:hypothetical protein [Selenomonadaceae bacterium]
MSNYNISFTNDEWQFFKWHLKDDLMHRKDIDIDILIECAVSSARYFVDIEGRIAKMNAHEGVIFVGTEFDHFNELAQNATKPIDTEKLIREAHRLAVLDVENDRHEAWDLE